MLLLSVLEGSNLIHGVHPGSQSQNDRRMLSLHFLTSWSNPQPSVFTQYGGMNTDQLSWAN